MGKIVAYKDGNKISIIAAVEHRYNNTVLRTKESTIIKLNNGIVLAVNGDLKTVYILKTMAEKLKLKDDIEFGYEYIATKLVKPIHDALYGECEGAGSGTICELDYNILIAYKDQMFILDYRYNILPIFNSLAAIGSKTCAIETFESMNLLSELPMKERVINYIYLADADIIDLSYTLYYINTDDLNEEVINCDFN